MNEITRLTIFINHNTILYQMGKKISIGSDTEPIIQDEISVSEIFFRIMMRWAQTSLSSCRPKDLLFGGAVTLLLT